MEDNEKIVALIKAKINPVHRKVFIDLLRQSDFYIRK